MLLRSSMDNDLAASARRKAVIRLLFVTGCLLLRTGQTQSAAVLESPRLEFTRLIAHWAGYADPGYLRFVDDVKPEVAQVGFYGAHFWSLADTAFGKGYPANLP